MTTQGGLNPYMIQQINTASPEKVILMLYDFGIRGCRTRNRELAARVLTELISALNFEHHEMALRFFSLYRFALDQVHQNRFEVPLTILKGLRETWETSVLKRTRTASEEA